MIQREEYGLVKANTKGYEDDLTITVNSNTSSETIGIEPNSNKFYLLDKDHTGSVTIEVRADGNGEKAGINYLIFITRKLLPR